MALTNFPDGISSFGVPVVGSGNLPVGNSYFFVHSSGSNGNSGGSEDPYATIDYAIGRCSANKGDVIIVKAGHAETITAAAGIDADVAGIFILGQGSGTDMPEITFTTATTADMDIDAANVTVSGIRFICGIDSQAAMIDVNAANATISGCEFRESAATGLTAIDVNGGAANACDGARIVGNRFYLTTAGNWDRAIELGEVANAVEITNNTIIGDFDDAGIHNITGKVLTNLAIVGNMVRNNQAAQHAIELVSACTGTAYNNMLVTDSIVTQFDAGALSCANNFWQSTTGGDGQGGFANAGGYNSWHGFRVNKAAANLPATTTQNIFAVAGGRVLVTALYGEVTTVIQAQACNLKVTSAPTTGTAVDLAANLDINADEAGCIYVVEGDGTALIGANAGAGLNAIGGTQIVLPIGNVRIETSATNTGATKWSLWYWPLDDGATVVTA